MRIRTAACLAFLTVAGSTAVLAQTQPWMQTFPVDTKALASDGENPYFILKPGYQLTFGGREAGTPVTLVITVLNETEDVGGVATRVVEERETRGGELIEVSRNYFAIHPGTKDVYYFGEDVDMYRKGKIVSHEGSWRHGVKGAHFGLMMPGKPAIGMRYYQELAKGVAMDRAEIVSLSDTLKTAAGAFEKCLKMKETTPLEPLAREYKTYAAGVGLVKDGDLELTWHQFIR